MYAQIIKINTITNSLKEALKKVYKKFQKTESQITVIVKQNEHENEKQKKRKKKESIACQEGDLIESQYFQGKIKPVVEKKGRTSLLDGQQIINDEDLASLSESVNISISNKEIFPNVLFTKKSKKKISLKHIGSDKSIGNYGKLKKNSKNMGIENFMTITEKNLQPEGEPTQQANSVIQEEEQKNVGGQNPQVKLSKLQKIKQKYEKLKDEKIEDNSSSSSMDDDEEESATESLFEIEERLSDAIEYIKENRIFQLEEYLYWFKTRYSSMPNRVQIKWRLLMAFCKENRKQYERASILYQQVMQLSESSPKSFLVDPADIYHKLGICYTEINRWNDGIVSFSKALTLLKKNDKIIKYAECLNNLGVLYLSAYQIEQAQKCFLLSYEIKKNEYPNHSKKLISCLLNLYECNLFLKNYQQADLVIKKIQYITKSIKTVDMLEAGILRRKGKLSFLKGDLHDAKSFFVKGFGLLSKRYPYSLEYGELCHDLAIIKLEEEKIEQAKNLLSLALSRLNFYYSTDSYAIQNLKSNLEMVQRLENKYNQTRGTKRNHKQRSVDTIIEESYGPQENSKSLSY